MNATSVAVAMIALGGALSHATSHVPLHVPPPSGLSGVQLVGDDFTSYRTRADLLAAISANLGGTGDWKRALYHDGRGAELVSLDESVRYNGHHTIKYRFPVGGGPPEIWPQLPRPLDHMWFRAKIRFERGFNTLGTIPASSAYKLLGWNLTGGDGSGQSRSRTRTSTNCTGTSRATTSRISSPNSLATLAASRPSGRTRSGGTTSSSGRKLRTRQ